MSEGPATLVLVADDDEDILALVKYVLEAGGYDVIPAHDGVEALGFALDRRPALAVLDVMMPQLDGLEVTRRLRATEGLEALPIILLTARVAEADVQEGFAAGATGYLRKPFSPQELRQHVAAALAGA
ncbi:MAG: response regulator transcription factor [Gaiellaceae bacterium]